MAKLVTYGPGGYDPTKPNNNVVEEIDIPDPPPPVKTAEQKLADARAALAAVATIEAPVLTADVLDVLTDLAAALED